MPNSPSVSIILPVFNEESRIADALAAPESLASAWNVEVIVVDGGSSDRTVEIARGFAGIRVLTCERANRGSQMNQGALAATGDTLLFLHADVNLPQQAIEAVRQALADERVLGGCFQIRFSDDVPPSLKIVAWGINLRTRLFRTATGDQTIFVRRRVFDQIGGYQTFPLMEDVEFFRQIKRLGCVMVLGEQVEISPRRWLKHGVWRTVMLMYLLRAGYWLGIHPATLKRFFL
ncbi:MAG: TIGR04283 family arsenosugar biosynthesis glycosyltransferase, partial [Acidobacteriota bacterium]